MKIKLFTVIIAALFYSCSKVDDIEKTIDLILQKIDIKVEFKDDVSPVVATMSLEGNFDQIDWLFEDRYVPNELSPNPVSYTFNTKGSKNIQVTAYKNGKKYFKKKVINIPDVANRFQIIGVIFNDPINLGFIDSFNTNLLADYGVWPQSLLSERIFKTIYPIPTDTIFLYTPIIIDINNFMQKEPSEQLINLSFRLGTHYELDFRSVFYLIPIYNEDRLVTPNSIHLSNLNTNSLMTVNLLCDWTRSK